MLLGVRPALFSEYRDVSENSSADTDPILYLNFYDSSGKKQVLNAVGEISRVGTNIGTMSVAKVAKNTQGLARTGGIYIYYVPYLHRFGMELLSVVIARNGGSYLMEMDDMGKFKATLSLPMFPIPMTGEQKCSPEEAIFSAATMFTLAGRLNRLYAQYSIFKDEHEIVKYFM